MQFVREHKKISIIVMLFLLIFLLFDATYAGYFRNIVDNYILETKGFYFNSSVLNVNGKTHNINNWDGVNSYPITVDVNNKKNEVKSTNADIEYDIFYECSSNVVCTASDTSGIIRKGAHTGSYLLTVTPVDPIAKGEHATVKTYVTSTSPYEKTLTGTYIIGVEKNNFTYNIEDSVNSKYMILNLTNSVAFYEVETAFTGYQVGDLISLDDYLKLSDANKAKCFSAKVTITIPVDKLALDMTTKSYLHRVSGSEVTEVFDSHNYVKKYTFKIDPTSSEKVLFYKYNISDNYTYPIVNDTSIIKVESVVAE